MTRMGVLLLAAGLAWAAPLCRADDLEAKIVPVAASEPAPVETTAPAPAAATEVVETTAAEVAPPAHAYGGLAAWAGRFLPSGQCARRAWDWLTYRPLSSSRWCSGCGRTTAPTCVPPLYTYFLWQYQAGCGGAGGHGSTAPAAAVVSEGQVEITEAAAPVPQ